MDFAALAQKKLDPVAWDYLEGGAEEEATLRDNLAGYGPGQLPPAGSSDAAAPRVCPRWLQRRR